MAAQVQPHDIGCEPSPSVPAETVIQDGWKTYLLFFAVSKAIGPSGYLDDLGVAVLDCDHCVMAKFGYPRRDEELQAPLSDSFNRRQLKHPTRDNEKDL